MKFTAIATALLLGSASAFVVNKSPSFVVGTSTTALQANIAVFGASGLTAQECIYQALKDGDTVIGLTRNPANVKVPKGSGGADADKPLVNDKLTVIGGDVTNAADVAKVFENDIDGVIVALGGKTSDGKIFTSDIMVFLSYLVFLCFFVLLSNNECNTCTIHQNTYISRRHHAH